MSEREAAFQGEIQLTRWNESSTNGATVTFWIHPEDIEHFKHFKVRSGKTPGQRFACVLVEMTDEEATGPVSLREPAPRASPAPRPSYPKAKPGPVAMTAVAYCKSATFREWVSLNNAGGERIGEEEAKHFILDVCGVLDDYGEAASRKHLDTDPEAHELFEEKVRRPYVQWLAEQEGFN